MLTNVQLKLLGFFPPINKNALKSDLYRFDFLAVQGIPKSLPQHQNSKASILQCSTFFMDQFSDPCMTTGINIVLMMWTFVSKVMSLIFNTLSRFVFSSKEQMSFNFIAAFTIPSDFCSPRI